MLESDQDRWLTYAEAGALLGISAQAGRMLAKRRGWERRTPNAYGDRAQVLVPAEAIVRPRSASFGVRTGSVITSDQSSPNGHDHPNVQVFEQAIGVLRDQLGAANRRADRAEEKADRLQAELVELRVSERSAADLAEYATGEAADLRQRLDAAEQRAGEERARADQGERQLAAVEGELIAARVETAGLRCRLEQARPKQVTEPPRSPWRRFLAWRRR